MADQFSPDPFGIGSNNAVALEDPSGEFSLEDFSTAPVPQPALEPPSADERSSWFRRFAFDPAIALARGIVAVPESYVGLADIPTLGAAGKALEAGGYGFQPKLTKEIFAKGYSPEMQAALKKVQEAKGLFPTIKAMVDNPSTIATTVIESVPPMLGGAAIARRIMTGLPKLAALKYGPTVAGAVGEGAIGAGMAAEQTRQESPTGFLTPEQALVSTASGAATSLIGVLGGGLARRLEIPDIETLLAGGKSAAQETAKKNVLLRVVGSAVSEGFFQELPQSMQEQAWQNYSLGKPLMEGVWEAGGQGLLAGLAMGGAGGIPSGAAIKPTKRKTTEVPSALPISQPIALPQKEPTAAVPRVEEKVRDTGEGAPGTVPPVAPPVAPPPTGGAVAAEPVPDTNAKIAAKSLEVRFDGPQDYGTGVVTWGFTAPDGMSFNVPVGASLAEIRQAHNKRRAEFTAAKGGVPSGQKEVQVQKTEVKTPTPPVPPAAPPVAPAAPPVAPVAPVEEKELGVWESIVALLDRDDPVPVKLYNRLTQEEKTAFESRALQQQYRVEPQKIPGIGPAFVKPKRKKVAGTALTGTTPMTILDFVIGAPGTKAKGKIGGGIGGPKFNDVVAALRAGKTPSQIVAPLGEFYVPLADAIQEIKDALAPGKTQQLNSLRSVWERAGFGRGQTADGLFTEISDPNAPAPIGGKPKSAAELVQRAWEEARGKEGLSPIPTDLNQLVEVFYDEATEPRTIRGVKKTGTVQRSANGMEVGFSFRLGGMFRNLAERFVVNSIETEPGAQWPVGTRFVKAGDVGPIPVTPESTIYVLDPQDATGLQLKEVAPVAPPKKSPLHETIEEAVERILGSRTNRASIDDRKRVGYFVRFLNEINSPIRRVADITREAIEQWRDSYFGEVIPATVQSYINSLRRFLEKAYRDIPRIQQAGMENPEEFRRVTDNILLNPDVWTVSEEVTPEIRERLNKLEEVQALRYVEQEDVIPLIEAIEQSSDPDVKMAGAVLAIGLTLGNRGTEIGQFTFKQFRDIAKGWIRNPHTIKKKLGAPLKSLQDVPVAKWAQSLILDYLKVRPEGSTWMFPSRTKGDHLREESLEQPLVAIANSIGLKLKNGGNLTLGSFRRIFSTHAEEVGVDPAIGGAVLGHKDSQLLVEKHYIKGKGGAKKFQAQIAKLKNTKYNKWFEKRPKRTGTQRSTSLPPIQLTQPELRRVIFLRNKEMRGEALTPEQRVELERLSGVGTREMFPQAISQPSPAEPVAPVQAAPPAQAELPMTSLPAEGMTFARRLGPNGEFVRVFTGEGKAAMLALARAPGLLDARASEMLARFVNSPLYDRLPRLTLGIADLLQGRVTGEYLPGERLLNLVRGAKAPVLAEELLHHIFNFLGDADKAMVNRERVRWLESVRDNSPNQNDRQTAGVLLELERDGQLVTSDDFAQFRQERPGLWSDEIYKGINDVEFFDQMMNERFQREFGTPESQGFVATMRQLFSDLWQFIKRSIGLSSDEEKLWRAIITGEYEFSKTPAEQPAFRQTAVPENLTGEPVEAEEDDWDTVQIASQKFQVRNPDRLTPEEREAGRNRVLTFVRDTLRLPGVTDTINQRGPGNTDENMIFRVTPNSRDASGEGRRLLEEFANQVRGQHVAGGDPAYTAELSNFIVKNWRVGNFEGVFDRELQDDLASVAAGDRSRTASLLQARTGLRQGITDVARNPDLNLRWVIGKMFDPDGNIRGVVRKLLTSFRSFFTDNEARELLRATADPDLAAFYNRLMNANARERGSLLYQRIRSALGPKVQPTEAQRQKAGLVEEALTKIVQRYLEEGNVLPEKVSKKMKPMELLALVSTEEGIFKIRDMMERAYLDARRNAAMDAMRAELNRESTTEERKEFLQNEIDVLNADPEAEPEQEFVNLGFQNPKYAFWQNVVTILGYNPVSIKLVERLIKSEFKGTQFGEPKAGEPDLRIFNFNELARQPEAEVRRVFEEYVKSKEKELAESTPAGRARILEIIRDQLEQQLERARTRVLDPLFEPPGDPAERVTNAMRLVALFNAGLFRDPRSTREFLDEFAMKPLLQRQMPKLADLIKQMFETSLVKQSDLPAQFVKELSKEYVLDSRTMEQAAKLFKTAFQGAFERARAVGKARALKAITPPEARVAGEKTPIWKKIEHLYNTGELNEATALRALAEANKWRIPTDAELSKMRAWAEREQSLREPSSYEIDLHGGDEAAAREAAGAVTEEERRGLMRKMQTQWSRWTLPVFKGWKDIFDPVQRYNSAIAAYEAIAANQLLKFGFGTRQLIDIGFQMLLHTPTRAAAYAFENWSKSESPNRNSELMADLAQNMSDAYKARLSVLRSTLQGFVRTLQGKGEQRNVEQLVSAINVFDRALLKADRMREEGHPVAARLLTMLALTVRFGRQFAAGLDIVQGVPAEAQELSHQIRNALREMGKTGEEGNIAHDAIMNVVKTERAEAISMAEQLLESRGLETTKSAVERAAWHILRRKMYSMAAKAGMPVDDWKAQNAVFRDLIGWNMPESGGAGKRGGPGGLVALAGRAAREVSARAGVPGIPFGMPFLFANAMGISLNRKLAWTPLGYFANFFKGSPWFTGAENIRQRQIEATIGTAVQGMLFSLVALGIWKFLPLSGPRDEKERAEWAKKGYRPGQLVIPWGDNNEILISGTTGPMGYFSPSVAAAGALRRVLDDQAERQARADAEAERRGLVAEKITGMSPSEKLSILAAAAWASATGGRTARGMMGSYSDFGKFNIRKAEATAVAGAVPGLPGLQEVGRMAGAVTDPKMAAFWDLLVPIPGSGSQRLNVFGQPMSDEKTVRRIFSVLSGGSGISIGDPAAGDDQLAYTNLFTTDYRPPAIEPQKGYDFNGTLRPMNEGELQKFIKVRGQHFREEVISLGPLQDTPDAKKLMQQAFQRANVQALIEVGATPASRIPSASAPRSQPSETPKAATVAAIQTPSGRSLTYGETSTGGRAVSYRGGRLRYSMATRGRGRRSTRIRLSRGRRARIPRYSARSRTLLFGGRGLRTRARRVPGLRRSRRRSLYFA